MAEATNPLELSKAFKDLLLKDEQSKGHYKRKNFLLLYGKILKALTRSLLEISIEEESARHSTYFKLDKWLACTQRYQSEYERQLAPHRRELLKDTGLSVDIYEKSFNLYQNEEDFIQAINATFWFAQRHSLMLRKPEKITSQQYFLYIHNELKYLESNSSEIQYFLQNVPLSSLIYILAKRVEDHVWRETQLNFADRFCFEVNHPEEANLPHHKEIKEEIAVLYRSLDSPERKRGMQILSRLNEEVRVLEEDAKKAASSEEGSLAGRRDNSGASTAISKNSGEANSSRAKPSAEKSSPFKEIDIATDIKLQMGVKAESLRKSKKTLRLNVEADQVKSEKCPSPQKSTRISHKMAGATRLYELLQQGTTEKGGVDQEEDEKNMGDIVARANAEEREVGSYSADTAIEIYEYVCLKSMECLGSELVKEKEEKLAVFDHLDKWIALEQKYFEIRNNEIKKQADITCDLFKISKELYKVAIEALAETAAGTDLIHFVFWSCFFQHNEKNKLDEGKEKTKICIPAGELVDFYVWREKAIKNKAEIKMLKKCFTKQKCSYAVRERIKNYVEQHKKRPYEQYAHQILKDPTYVIKSTGSHKKRFEEELDHVLWGNDYKHFYSKQTTEKKNSCCRIF